MGRKQSMARLMSNPWKRIRDMGRVFYYSGKTAPLFTPGFFRAFGRGMALCFRDGYAPEDAFRFGLFDPRVPRTELSKFMSKKNLMEFQRRVNPASWSFVTEDKSIFYLYFKGLGLPTPRIYAVFFKSGMGWSADGGSPGTRDDWIRFFEEAPFGEFVIKPCRGVFGQKIRVLEKSGGEFKDASGKTCASGDLYDMMNNDEKYDRFIIQERLANHPDIVHLTGTQFLQTARVVTYIDRAGECRILLGAMRFLGGNNVIDNFFSGRSGNMIAPVNVETGIAGPARARDAKDATFRDVAAHPATGARIEGFRIPFWQECCCLARDGAMKLLPVRTIGWDVALTPKGPVIVEANMWWNPANLYSDMGAVMEKWR